MTLELRSEGKGALFKAEIGVCIGQATEAKLAEELGSEVADPYGERRSSRSGDRTLGAQETIPGNCGTLCKVKSSKEAGKYDAKGGLGPVQSEHATAKGLNECSLFCSKPSVASTPGAAVLTPSCRAQRWISASPPTSLWALSSGVCGLGSSCSQSPPTDIRSHYPLAVLLPLGCAGSPRSSW